MKLVRKYEIGFIISTATLDGYRRQNMNDRNNNILDFINEERKILRKEVGFISVVMSIHSIYDRIVEEIIELYYVVSLRIRKL